jgi:arginine:agmatine antiporter
MGALPNEELQKSAAPFADCARLVLGDAGGAVVSFCAAAGCLGSLGGWVLATAQTAKAASDGGLFPRIFGVSNAHGVPVKGLIITGFLMTGAQLLTISPTASKEFGVISSIAVLMTLVAYLYVAAALAWLLPKLNLLTGIIIGVTTAYCLWAVLGSNPSQVMWLAIALLLSAVLYSINQITHKQPPPPQEGQ